MAILAHEMPKRINPQTGPTSPSGKSRSSQNSTTHGCRSLQHRVLPGEDPAHYEAVRQRWYNEYGGEDENDAALIERLAQSDWRLIRCERKLAEAEEHINANKPLWEWTEEDHQLITLARRYANQALRAYNNARRDLDNLRLTRQREIKAIVEADRAMTEFALRNPEPPKPEPKPDPSTSQQPNSLTKALNPAKESHEQNTSLPSLRR